MSRTTSNGKHILIVDDEPLVSNSLSKLLTIYGYTVSSVNNGHKALEILKTYPVDIIISDIKMPEMDGVTLLKQVKASYPEIFVIIITGYGTVGSAVEAMREGAYDYVTKPISDSEIKIILERTLKQRKLLDENVSLKKQLEAQSRDSFHHIVGKSPSMQKIYNLIETVCSTRASVLIYGESGTGKRLIAHALHKYNEQERGKPFIEVSCGALTETLLESELFGHAKGSFTGAIKDRIGRFELAHGGTIFLDEIDAFSPALQVKLLRVIQDGEFERVGDAKTLTVDVRIIAATNQNLEDLIVQGKFRKDLFYRLNIICIDLPALRDRKEDIPMLVEHFIKKHAKHVNKKIQGISEKALAVLTHYDWPGNVRQLENIIERSVILTKGPMISPADFPENLVNPKPKMILEGNGDGRLKLKDALMLPEKDLVVKVLESVKWNRTLAAEALGVNRTTLYKKMQKFGLLKNHKASYGVG